MRSYSILVMVLLFLLPGGAMAARWQKPSVPVWDYTPDGWRPYIQATIDDFNANLPPNAPRLAYAPMGEVPCDALPDYGRKGGITVCAHEAKDGRSYTEATSAGQRFLRARILLTDNWWQTKAQQTCHEFAHAVSNVPDDYDIDRPDSCVQGTLDHLGSWDIAYAAKVYRAAPSPGSEHHHKRRRSRHH